jgi:stage IV sporulation protein FB
LLALGGILLHLITIAQTKVKLNWWFLLLLFVYVLLDIWEQAIGVFIVVIWHELWHVFVAKSNGLKVHEIELLPYGGVAKIDGLVGKEGNLEVKVALAGPLSNFFLALMIAAALHWGWFYHPLAYFIFIYNLLIGLFNLLPVLPLDGGRILRGCLANYWGVLSTTVWIARLGQGIALLMIALGGVGLYLGIFNFHLIIIALFLWRGAVNEREQAFYVHWRSLLAKKQHYLREKIIQGITLVARPDLMIKEVLPKLNPNKYNLIVVIDQQGAELDTISEEQLFRYLTEGSYDVTLWQILNK